MQTLERLATDRGLLLRLHREASGRMIKTWHDYAADIAASLTAV
jgi:hypothetical protein